MDAMALLNHGSRNRDLRLNRVLQTSPLLSMSVELEKDLRSSVKSGSRAL